MNDNVSPMWHQNHQADTTSNPELSDDFSSFLDFGSLPLSLSSPFGENDETLTMDTDFCLDGNSPGQNDRGGGMPNVTQAEIMDMQFHEMQKSMQHVHQQMMNHQHAIQQQQHRHNSSNSMIPPTPTSMEMIGGMPQTNGHDIHSQLMMDNFGVYRDEQVRPRYIPIYIPLLLTVSDIHTSNITCRHTSGNRLFPPHLGIR